MGTSNSVSVTAAPGTFYISSSRGNDGAAVAGSYAAPWKTIQSSVNRVNPGSTLHVLKGTYAEHVVIRKAVTIHGESIGESVVTGTGTGTVLRIGAHTGQVTVRRLTVTSSGATPLAAGIEVYGGGPVTLTNNIVKSNWTGISVNEDAGQSLIANNTFSANSMHHLVVRRAGGVIRSNIFLSRVGCVAYGYIGATAMSGLDFNLTFGAGLGLCPSPNPPPPATNLSADPKFFNQGMFYVGAGSPAFNSGPTIAGYLDVDSSRNDRGAYGGPFGELHFPAVAVSNGFGLLGLIGVAAGMLGMKRRRSR